MKEHCAPDRKYDANTGTCFTYDELVNYSKDYNSNYSKNKEDNINYSSTSKKGLHKLLKKKLHGMCGNLESCWVDQKFLIDDDIKNAVKPLNPDTVNNKKNTWLSTLDINNVMEQYEKKNKDFMFIGAVPINFDQIYKDVCNFNLQRIIKTKKCIGIIFNHDPSYKSGSHWVSLFIDFRNKNPEINFFDSVGSKPPKEVWTLIRRLYDQSKKINDKCKVHINTINHQLKNSECGVYSLYFIISQLNGITFKEIVHDIIRDEDMYNNRKKYFRDYEQPDNIKPTKSTKIKIKYIKYK
jgi:hypothetical protein